MVLDLVIAWYSVQHIEVNNSSRGVRQTGANAAQGYLAEPQNAEEQAKIVEYIQVSAGTLHCLDVQRSHQGFYLQPLQRTEP